ncbi:MAG: PDZ domain-containing protein [Planctomycetaceae bacterium]|jgi:carboxyl-terminal processing protease|nr:PDZ domain-containing protein [Planctomycetaceae bacterium]
MPKFNFYLILLAVLIYALTANVTLRDRLLISTLHRIERNAYAEPSAKDLFEGAMSGMTEILSNDYGDQYSSYIRSSRQSRYLDNTNNRYDGFGFSTRLHEKGEEKKLFITFPFHDSPAYRAGLRSGDQVLQIDGETVGSSADIAVIRLLKQQERHEFCFSVVPFGQTEPQEFFLRPEKVHRESVEGDYRDSEGQPLFYLESHPQIGYIRMTSFNDTTSQEFADALDSMKKSGASSFILDLRDNSGGNVWTSVLIAQMLLPNDSERDTIVSMRPRNGRERSYTLSKRSQPQLCTLPMVVLINGETASASEILAAALQDHHRATIVGTRSFGKGVIQGITSLPFQSGILQLTDSEFRRPSGAAIHRKPNAADSDDWGIIPDKIHELTEKEESAVGEYRLLRSNVISAERSTVLEQFRQQIIAEQENESGLTGNAPYYDAQLDEAIKKL